MISFQMRKLRLREGERLAQGPTIGMKRRYTHVFDNGVRGASPHLFLLEPTPSSKAPPQGFLLVHLTSGQTLDQVPGAQQ